jgi:glycolate oxidase FAD binding subunit
MAVLGTLVAACGNDRVREAREADAIDGVEPSYVISPRDAGGVANAMGVAAELGLTVVPRGAGTKLDWGNPPSSADVVLDVSALDQVIEHAADDLIVRVQPGVRLTALREVLAPAGQCLAVDEVVPGSTVGGVIATGLSGPSRFLHGGIRDLLIGVTVVRADGAVARSGGRVVKNVAGYDLCKLYTGSLGTLGIVTEAIFRLHPIPQARAHVSIDFPDERAAASPIAAVLGSAFVPSAVEIDAPEPGAPVALSVLVEGASPSVPARAERLARLLGPAAVISTDPPPWWAPLPGPVSIRITGEISAVPRLLRATWAVATEQQVPLSIRGSAGTGVMYVGLASDVDPSSAARILTALRTACAAAGGFAVLVRGPLGVKRLVDAWGPVPGLDLMRRVKENFDPNRSLAPGRFVGGI